MELKKVAVLIEKFCDLNPSLGVTSGYSNIVGSLNSSGLADISIFHYDEYFANNNQPIDQFLLQSLRENKPDCLVVSFYPFWDHRNVRLETFGRIIEMGIPIVAIWFDFGHGHLRELIMRVAGHVNLNIVLDTHFDHELFMSMWVPQEETLFKPGNSKEIEVSFVGTRYPDRNEYLAYLQGQRSVYISGGQRVHRLTIEGYADILQKSKVTLNFPSKPDGTIQAKCRIYEAMLCRAMLLERDNDAIKRWFTPMVHYVPFSTPQDMVEKINYYLVHDEEREMIIENAFNKMTTDYSSKKWWSTVFEKLHIC
jgi:hypothetical protein